MTRPWATGSALDRVSACPASAVLEQHQSISDYGKKGNELHSVLEGIVEGRGELPGIKNEELSIPPGAKAEIAFSYDCVSGEAKLLGKIPSRGYPNEKFSTIYATADVFAHGQININESLLLCSTIVDWKTGREAPKEDCWQLKFLAMASAKALNADYARTRITHIPGGAFVSHSPYRLWTKSELAQIESDIRAMYDKVNSFAWKDINISKVVSGPHCHFCPAFTSCPYQKELLMRFFTGGLVRDLVEDDVITSYNQLGHMKTHVDRYEKSIRAYVDNSGPISLGGGYMYGKRYGRYVRFKIWSENE